MSYILNALRKSEQDRQAQETSTPEIAILETPTKHNSKISWLVITLILVNVLVLIFFIFFNPKQQPTTSFSTAESKTPFIVAPIQSEKQKTVSKTDLPKQKTIVAKPTQSQRNDSPTQKKHASISKMLKQKRFVKKPVVKPPVKNVAVIPKKTYSAKPPASIPTQTKTKPRFVDNESPTRKHSKPGTSNNIPFLRSMAPDFRRNVPNLNINVFVYAKNPEERFVIIDMKKYRSGQETADGLKIKEIKSDSLVLNYQNKTFQIKRP